MGCPGGGLGREFRGQTTVSGGRRGAVVCEEIAVSPYAPACCATWLRGATDPVRALLRPPPTPSKFCAHAH